MYLSQPKDLNQVMECARKMELKVTSEWIVLVSYVVVCSVMV